MRVRIDHSRHAGVAAKIDDLRSRWNCPARGDTLNFVVLDDDDGIGDCAVSVPQLSNFTALVAAVALSTTASEKATTRMQKRSAGMHVQSRIDCPPVVLARLPQPPRSRKHVSVQEVRSIRGVTSGPPPISAIAASPRRVVLRCPVLIGATVRFTAVGAPSLRCDFAPRVDQTAPGRPNAKLCREHPTPVFEVWPVVGPCR